MDQPLLITDEQLAAQVVCQGEQAKEAFEKLHERMCGTLASIARANGIVPPDDLSIANATLFKLWLQLNMKQLDLTQPIAPWLTTVAKNLCRSQQRSRKRDELRRTPLDESSEYEMGKVDQLLRSDKAERVQLVLQAINPSYASALQRRHMHEQSVSQMAQELSLDSTQVYRLLDNARRAFLASWQEIGGEDTPPKS